MCQKQHKNDVRCCVSYFFRSLAQIKLSAARTFGRSVHCVPFLFSELEFNEFSLWLQRFGVSIYRFRTGQPQFDHMCTMNYMEIVIAIEARFGKIISRFYYDFVFIWLKLMFIWMENGLLLKLELIPVVWNYSNLERVLLIRHRFMNRTKNAAACWNIIVRKEYSVFRHRTISFCNRYMSSPRHPHINFHAFYRPHFFLL